jgi:hypothetical protein
MSAGQQNQTQASSDKIKDEVRTTVRQLTEMTRSVEDFDQFCSNVLKDIVRITGAHGALLWQVSGDRTPRLTHHSGQAPHETARAILNNENQLHTEALMTVIDSQKPRGLSSDTFAPDHEPEGGTNGTVDERFLMLLSPVFDRKESCCGALELVQRGDITPSARDGYLRFLNQIAQLFQRWHEHQDLNRLSKSADKWTEKVDFINEVHGTIDTKETAYSIANEARRLLNADRVSVAKWNGRRCKVMAISSQDKFDNRANVVKKLGSVATASVSGDTPFWITGDTEGLAPSVAKKINDYLDESNSRTLAVLPLAKRPDDSPTLEMKKSKREKPVKLGCVIVEYFDADVTRDQISEDCNLIVGQSQLALNNARRHNEIFLAPLWKRLGWLQKLLFRDHLAKTITGLIAFGLLTLAMIFWPIELKMRVDGVMHPETRQSVYAQTPGIITEILIDENSEVSAGQPLLKMKNVDLSVQMNQTKSQIATLRAQFKSAEFKINRGSRDPKEARDVGAQLSLLKEELTSKLKLQELLEEKQQALVIAAPIDGTIITRDPKRRLSELPVNASQMLLQVSRQDGPWELEIRIPQHKIAYVDQAIAKSLADGDDGKLKVEFATATNPNETLVGKLVSVSDRTFPDQQGVPHYRGIVSDVDVQPLEKPRPGAGVTVRIFCGKVPLGFYCFYQPWDWFRTWWF